MKTNWNKLTLLTVGIAGIGLIACGPNDKEGDPQPVEHTTAKQALETNAKSLAKDFSARAEFLESSRILNNGVQLAGAGASVTVDDSLCTTTPDGTECEPTSEPEPVEIELDVDVNAETEAMLDELEARVINDASVEAEEEFAITYLVRGDIACAQEGAPLDQECVSQVDAAEIRVVLTSPSDGDIDVDILIGPDRVNPLSFQVHQGLLALEVDLGAVEDAADHIGGIVGEEIEFPATFEGRLRAELSSPSDHEIAAAFSVLQAVKIADGDFSLSVGQSIPLYSLALDANAETLTGTSNVGPVDGLFPVTSYEYDGATSTETETSYDLGFHLDGATSTAVLDVANEVLDITGWGLGDDTSTISIDGEQVVAIDLNPDDNRTLDATVSVEDDALKLEVEPAFDLRMAFELAKAVDVLDDVDDWMLDDVLEITLDGAAKPTLLLHEEQLEVVDGTLTMSLQNAGITHTIAAGQCVLGSQGQEPTPISGGGTDSGSDTMDPQPVDEEESFTPLDDVEVGACQ